MNKRMILFGWKRSLYLLRFALQSIIYLLNRKKYRNFILARKKNGLLRTVDIVKKYHLTKTALVNGKYYTNPLLPAFPSSAYDQAVSRGALNYFAAGTKYNTNIGNVILGISGTCTFACRHCYEQRNVNAGHTVPIERWKRVIAQLQDEGTSIIILSGGEPMLRYEGVLELLSSADHAKSEFHLHTAGYGMVRSKAAALKKAGLSAVAVGLDDVDPDRCNALRGTDDAYSLAVAALQTCADEGLMTYTNLCLTKEFIRDDSLVRYFELMKNLKVSMVQLLDPRPCGGYVHKNGHDLFNEQDRERVRAFVKEFNTLKQYSEFPLAYYVSDIEQTSGLGCTMGGLTHCTIDTAGNVNPCVFVPVSFGSILTEEFPVILRRMRSVIQEPIHHGCASELLHDIYSAESVMKKGRTVQYSDVSGPWKAQLNGKTARHETAELQ